MDQLHWLKIIDLIIIDKNSDENDNPWKTRSDSKIELYNQQDHSSDFTMA